MAAAFRQNAEATTAQTFATAIAGFRLIFSPSERREFRDFVSVCETIRKPIEGVEEKT